MNTAEKPKVEMIVVPNLWEISQQEKREERLHTEHLIATGQVTAEEMQRRNSLVARGVEMRIDWEGYFKRKEENRKKHAAELRAARREARVKKVIANG